MQSQPQNSSGGGNQGKYTQKNRGGQGAKKQQDKQPKAASNVPQVTGWGDLYANVDSKSGGGNSAMNQPKSENFKPFVPGGQKQPPSQSNDMNDLQKMISDNSKKKLKGASKAETMQDQDDAILSIDQNVGASTKPKPFSNKNQPKNKKDPNFTMAAQKNPATGQKKERQLEKTHASWVSGTSQNASLNDLMRTEEGSYDQFAGKKTTYDETAYGYTKFDETKLSKAQIDHAKKVEREILNEGAGGNTHLAEERGQLRYGQQEDEEIQYSGVIRSKQTILKNHKKFKCFNKKVTGKFSKATDCSFEGLLNPEGWAPIEKKFERQTRQNQWTNKSQSQSHSSAPKAESVTGVYKGGGTQQISSTQTAYIQQQANNPQTSTPSMKVPSGGGWTPSAVAVTKPFVPKGQVQNIQPFQAKEESSTNSQANATTMKVNQPSFTPNSESFNTKNEGYSLKSDSQAFTPSSETQQFNEFKPQQSYNNYTPKNQQSQSQFSNNTQSYNQGNQNGGYQNRHNNQYQQKHGNQYNQNSQYQGNNFQQPYSQGGQMYQQKHNNYQNNQYGNYDNQGYQGQSYGSNSNFQQNNQQNQYRSVNNSNSFNQNNFQNSQQQWGQGNLYYMQNSQMGSQQDYTSQNQGLYNQGRQSMNNNYNQSHGSQGQNVQATGGFQNSAPKMSMSATAFKPNWQKD